MLSRKSRAHSHSLFDTNPQAVDIGPEIVRSSQSEEIGGQGDWIHQNVDNTSGYLQEPKVKWPSRDTEFQSTLIRTSSTDNVKARRCRIRKALHGAMGLLRSKKLNESNTDTKLNLTPAEACSNTEAKPPRRRMREALKKPIRLLRKKTKASVQCIECQPVVVEDCNDGKAQPGCNQILNSIYHVLPGWLKRNMEDPEAQGSPSPIDEKVDQFWSELIHDYENAGLFAAEIEKYRQPLEVAIEKATGNL